MKRFVDEISCRRNVLSTKIFRRTVCQRSVISTKCCVDENFPTKVCRTTAFRRNFFDQKHNYPIDLPLGIYFFEVKNEKMIIEAE
jgi:hypothetical protein